MTTDGSDDAPAGPDDDGPDDAPDAAGAAPDGVKRKRRRRRKRSGATGAPPIAADGAPNPSPSVAPSPSPSPGAPAVPAPAGPQPPRERGRRERGGRGERGGQPQPGQPQQDRGPRPERGGAPQAQHGQPPAPPQGPRPPQDRGPRPPRGERGGGGGRGERADRGDRNRDRGTRDPRANLDTTDTSGEPYVEAPELAAAREHPLPIQSGATPRLTQGARQLARDDDNSEPEAREAWGTDEPGPAPAVTLAADLPLEPAGDLDPLTHPLTTGPGAPLDDVATVIGVRFVVGGRITWCDAAEGDYAIGDRVLADSERGARLAWVAVAAQRRGVRDRNLRRIIRRAGEQDAPRDDVTALRAAKDAAAALRMPLKVFRVETQGAPGRGGKVLVYYTSDEQRLDVRELLRDVSAAVGARVELRQLGVRDEAKAVGGIGSCGLTLCCTTWLPDFVPVSIKMAKDQGLVLTPTKVSGQCGRLKCCLVYEQAAYAELRKGLPKLGKRVIGARGEGRVVEVDVLRQRVRVSYGPGDTEVVPAADVKPMFPPGGGPPGGAAAHAHADEPDEPDETPEPPEPSEPSDLPS